MNRYFIAGNFWLLMALLLYVGRTVERTQPVRYSVFHGGQWFTAGAYGLLVLAVLAVAIAFFTLMWKTRR